MNFFQTIFNYIRETYTDRLFYFPSNIRISLLIILFCVIAVLELYLYISFRRAQQIKKKRDEAKWKEYIDNMLANLVIFDESDST